VALDRGTLARIDRRIFAELGYAAATQAVKVPLSDAGWSTWRRYCQAVGLTMGEGIAGLITHELLTSVKELGGDGDPVFSGQAEDRLAARELLIASRERGIEEVEERLRSWTERLRSREAELRERERRILLASKPVSEAGAAGRKVGRNERCPCGSGFKYKRCHGR
jgi:hypothetical protein